MYKDKDKQREAAHKAIKRFRAKQETKAITEAMGITKQGITDRVLPERTAQGNIRVSKPGDSDYKGVAI
ncbi:hypothetical protein LCGC14_2942460 [marine sediment metagenome]|uniref:Uncharacterized protein n=1 Tax=marine sediment metagenome TaxID=412755 RepID=A0A0F9A8P0_9ZZZZ